MQARMADELRTAGALRGYSPPLLDFRYAGPDDTVSSSSWIREQILVSWAAR